MFPGLTSLAWATARFFGGRVGQPRERRRVHTTFTRGKQCSVLAAMSVNGYVATCVVVGRTDENNNEIIPTEKSGEKWWSPLLPYSTILQRYVRRSDQGRDLFQALPCSKKHGRIPTARSTLDVDSCQSLSAERLGVDWPALAWPTHGNINRIPHGG